jgi:hypothetical protein
MSILDQCKTYVGLYPTKFYPDGVAQTFYYLENGDDVEKRPVAYLQDDGSVIAYDIQHPMVYSDIVFCQEEHLKKYRIVKHAGFNIHDLPISERVQIFGSLNAIIDRQLEMCPTDELFKVVSPEVEGWGFTAFALSNLMYSDGSGSLPRGLYADIIALTATLAPGDTAESLFKSGVLLHLEVKSRHSFNPSRGLSEDSRTLVKLNLLWAPKSKQIS